MDKTLEIYIDESGNLSFNEKGSRFYIISFVAIESNIDKNKYFSKLKCDYFHAAPLLRAKDEFLGMNIVERKKIFMSMNILATTIGIKSKSFLYEKKYENNLEYLIESISKSFFRFIYDNKEEFEKYEKIEFFYDDGQKEITKIINVAKNAIQIPSTLNILKSNKPRMFELADYITELVLLEKKYECGQQSKNEKSFFDTKELRNKYLRPYYKKIRI